MELVKDAILRCGQLDLCGTPQIIDIFEPNIGDGFKMFS